MIYTEGLDRQSFAAAEVVQDGVVLRLEVIGEAIVQMRRHFPDRINEVGDVQQMIDLRNYLVHQYHAISANIVWDIVQHEVPALRDRVEKLLRGTGCQ